MARKNYVLDTLLEKGSVVFSPHGNSMTPRIQSGSEVEVQRVDVKALRVGDVVYAKVKGTYYLHLFSAVELEKDRYQISNNKGHVNGWVSGANVFGVCVRIKEKVVLTAEDLDARLGYTKTKGDE